MEFQILSNGIEIPALGLGTWFIDDDKADKAVISAVKIGYRHIDTAQAYGNERGVGAGIKACGIPREELFVTSKVAAEAKTYDAAAKSIDETLDKMGLPYIDLMLIHSPQPWAEWRDDKRYFEENVQVWKALEDAYTAGKVKAIGVSNFLIDDLENLLSHCKIRPMVNQLLIHIGNTPAELIAYGVTGSFVFIHLFGYNITCTLQGIFYCFHVSFHEGADFGFEVVFTLQHQCYGKWFEAFLPGSFRSGFSFGFVRQVNVFQFSGIPSIVDTFLQLGG